RPADLGDAGDGRQRTNRRWTGRRRGAGDADRRGDRRRRRTRRGDQHELASRSHEPHPPFDSARSLFQRARGTLVAPGEAALRAAYRPADELERLFTRREEPGGALLLDRGEQSSDLRPRRQAELVASQERLVRVVRARVLDGLRELGRAEDSERLARPPRGAAAEPA